MNLLQLIKTISARINRNADHPARRWNEVRAKDSAWSSHASGRCRSVQWNATKIARQQIAICGERARKGYLILDHEVWLLLDNPYAIFMENAMTHQQIILARNGKHLASPVRF